MRPASIRRRLRPLVGIICIALAGAATGTPPALAAPSSADSLRWHACEGRNLRGAECATLDVPVDWASPGPARFRIGVGRVRADGPASERLGVLVFNPGGPGGDGLSLLTDIASVLPPEVRERFDLVTWDPRGTGITTPALADCRMALPSELPNTGPVDWPALATIVYQEESAAMATCLSANAGLAPFLGTWYSARDLNALRAALGEDQITYWGMSYGSTIGRVFAQAFPGRLRAMVLDGTIDPLSTAGSYARESIWSVATGWARLAAWLGPDLRAAHRRVMTALQERVITASSGAVVGRWEIDGVLNDLSSSQSSWPEARLIIRAARIALFDSRPALRQRAADMLARALVPDPDDPPDLGFDPVLSLVNCADLPERLTVEDAIQITVQAARVGGLSAGLGAASEASSCAGLPALGRPLRPSTAIALPTPPVIVNSVADPRTPWVGARTAANVFVGSAMITYDSAQHVSWLQTRSGCVNDPVTRYVLTRRLPVRDVTCALARPAN